MYFGKGSLSLYVELNFFPLQMWFHKNPMLLCGYTWFIDQLLWEETKTQI